MSHLQPAFLDKPAASNIVHTHHISNSSSSTYHQKNENELIEADRRRDEFDNRGVGPSTVSHVSAIRNQIEQNYESENVNAFHNADVEVFLRAH